MQALVAHAARRTATARAAWWHALAGLLLLALLGFTNPAFAQSASSYDHTATGYPLRGKHEDVRCEACHQRGIFKGTPRDCATCHAQNNTRGAVAMPNLHIQTTQACDACHSVNGFSFSNLTDFLQNFSLFVKAREIV